MASEAKVRRMGLQEETAAAAAVAADSPTFVRKEEERYEASPRIRREALDRAAQWKSAVDDLAAAAEKIAEASKRAAVLAEISTEFVAAQEFAIAAATLKFEEEGKGKETETETPTPTLTAAAPDEQEFEGDERRPAWKHDCDAFFKQPYCDCASLYGSTAAEAAEVAAARGVRI
jgi:hypothetical protein